VPEEEKQKSIP